MILPIIYITVILLNFVCISSVLGDLNKLAYVKKLSRHKRHLIYPDGDPARVQLIIGLGIPVDLEEQAVTVGYVIKIQYHLPLNSTDYTDPIFNYANQVLARGIDNQNENNVIESNASTETSPKKTTEIQVIKDDELSEDVSLLNIKNEIDTENSTDSVLIENELSGNDEADVYSANMTANDMTYNNYDDPALKENIESRNNVTLNVAKETEETKETEKQEESNASHEKTLRRKRSRWDLYKIIEVMAEHYGLSGRACLLKTICESADTPFTHHNGLLGELAHVLFTPSTTKEPLSHHTDNEYHAAEVIGKKNMDKCDVLFPDCESSILEYFTQIDLTYLGKLY